MLPHTESRRSFFTTRRIRSGHKTRAWSFLHGLLLAIGLLANAWAVDYPVGQFGCEFMVNSTWMPQPRITNDKAQAQRSPTENRSVTSMRFGRSVQRTDGNCGEYSVTVGVKAGIGYLNVRGQQVGVVSNAADKIEYRTFKFVLYQGETAQIDLLINLSNAASAGGSLHLQPGYTGMQNPRDAIAPVDLWYAVPSDYDTGSWHQKTWTPTPTYIGASNVYDAAPSLWRHPDGNGNVGLALWTKKFVAPKHGHFMFRLRVKNGWAVLRCNDWDVKSLDSQAFQAGDIKEDYWHSAQLRPGDVLNIAYGVGFHGNSFYAGCDLQAFWVPNKPPQLVDLERLPAWTCSAGDYQPPSITFYDSENDPIYYYWSLRKR